jgi:hypothetical protein
MFFDSLIKEDFDKLIKIIFDKFKDFPKDFEHQILDHETAETARKFILEFSNDIK